MPAPFVIAHLQVANLLEKAGASLTADQRAQVFLTNALTGWVPVRHPQSNFGYAAFTEERDAAEAVKQAETILVILGNPPYNGYAGIARIEEERDLTTAYRTPVPGLAAPQGQGLNDLYVRFFRIAERRIIGDVQARGNRNGRGLVSFISNNAWLDGLSHISMRARYLSEFQSIYIDNLNGDKYQTGKTTPDGHPDPSAFSTPQNREGIQVGTSITTLLRTATAPTAAAVKLRNLWGTTKLSHLDREARREAVPTYEPLTPTRALGLPFAERTHSAAYTSWPTLNELFPKSFPGIKTSRDSELVAMDPEVLEARMLVYFDRSTTSQDLDRLVGGLIQDETRFNAKEARGFLLGKGFRKWQVMRFIYRPFDVRWLYWEPETKLLDEKRTDYVKQFVPGTPTIVAQQKSRGAAYPPQISSTLACIDVMDRSASLFPLELVEDERGLLATNEVRPNISAKATAWIGGIGAAFGSLFFHAIAVMHTPIYRHQNEGALLTDWPRVPLPADVGLLTHSAILGRDLANLLDPESDIQLQAEWSFLASLKIPPEYTSGTQEENDRRNADRFALTAGWGGAGQGATVMPRRGKAPEREWTETERARLATLAATQSLTPEAALDILGPRCVDVYLNAESFWAAVPVNVWDYTLGGYQVLKKWLSYREQPLLGRPLHPEEARYFAQVVRRIANILLLGPALDASYAAILPTATGLPAKT